MPFARSSLSVLFLFLLLPSPSIQQNSTSNRTDEPSKRTFQVDYERHVFLKDGQPYRYISGEIHYFRIPPSLWQDRLHKVRAAGLNAVQVYIPWNFHEPTIGSFNFEGDRDVAKFVRLAQQNELDVLLRIGPYVCAELEFGGMPWWLLKDSREIDMIRTSNKRYLFHVRRWFAALLPVLKPLLHKNGGPVLMLQIENEYGSVAPCDKPYLRWLRDEVRAALGDDVVLYTTDGYQEKALTCGSVEGVYATVDFGTTDSDHVVQERFETQRKHSGGGPYVNSEFYTTWFSQWGERSMMRQRIAPTLKTMEAMWRLNASFSFYMIHGGTNFDFWAATEVDGPVVTSYDYAAPISEEGQITPLYLAIRDWIGEKVKLGQWTHVPLAVPKNRTGVAIDSVMGVKLPNFIQLLNSTADQCIHSNNGSLSFEAFDTDHGFVWYSTILEAEGTELSIPSLHDHIYVYLDGKFQGNLSVHDRTGGRNNLTFVGGFVSKGQRLDILVENIGRLVFPLTRLDPKGLFSTVKIDGIAASNQWVQCAVNLDALHTRILSMVKTEKIGRHEDQPGVEPIAAEPSVFAAKFTSPADVDWSEAHTFLDSRGWGHGVALMNGFNLGRYWPLQGPQLSMFVPGSVMKQDENLVILIELTGSQKTEPSIPFVPTPLYNWNSGLLEEEEMHKTADANLST